jgi:hypothetical protein
MSFQARHLGAGIMKCSPAISVSCVDVGSVGEKIFNDRQVAVKGSFVQRCFTLFIF